MNLSRIAALLALLLSNSAMAEPSWDKLFKAVGEVIENRAKNNQQQDGANNTDASPQSSTADAGQSTEGVNNSGPLALAPQSRSLERTLKLVARSGYGNNDAAGFFVTPTGKLVMWGSNEDVRLGLSEAKYTTSAGITEYQYKKFYDKPVVHPAFDDVVSVDACAFRTIVLTKKGEAWIFGKGGSIVPAALAPTKIPGDGYIDARVTCENPSSHERFNLLKNDGTFWVMGDGPGSLPDFPEPVKAASGVKALRSMNDSFVLLMNNGEVAMLGLEMYRVSGGSSSSGGYGKYINERFPFITAHPKLKDIVRIDANDMASGFIAYEANGNVYEMPLKSPGNLASGLDRLSAMKRREIIDGSVFNKKIIRGNFSYPLPILTPELTNAKNVCYGNNLNDGHLMKSNLSLYGLKLDNAGDVSVWVSKYMDAYGFNLKALGLTENKLIPQKIPFLSNVDEISCGALYFAVKTKNGEISIFPGERSASLVPVVAKPNKMNFLFNENAEFYK